MRVGVSKLEASNRAEHAELAAQAKAQSKEISDVRVGVNKLEASNEAERAELTAQLKAQGKELSDVRVEVGKLFGYTGQSLVEALKRLVGGKDSEDRPPE